VSWWVAEEQARLRVHDTSYASETSINHDRTITFYEQT